MQTADVLQLLTGSEELDIDALLGRFAPLVGTDLCKLRALVPATFDEMMCDA